jgi:superfamily I DNA and RNA helicase
LNDLIVFKSFGSSDDQDKWLVESIQTNIAEEELLPEDIIVINPDPLKTRKAVAASRSIFQGHQFVACWRVRFTGHFF